MAIRLGSLFDGISAFPLSASKYGIKAVWASEIESFPIRVSTYHFPSMKHLGDITKINGAEIEPVDIITFGSPCQDLSIAGKREGLGGKRSGLFMHAIRIIREMRDSTGGQYPRFAVWENVPGAYSSNGGQDFRAVLEEIAEAELPMPRSGKWAEAGMVRTERVDIAWRTLDAQYWGVPQRRKRIFLVADFRGRCASEILFKSESVSGNLAESGEAREEAAATTRDGVEAAGGNSIIEPQLYDMTHAEEVMRPIEKGLAPTLNARMGTGGNQVPVMLAFGPGNQHDIAHAVRAQPSKADKPSSTTYVVRTAQTSANGHGIAEGITHTLDGAQGQAVCSIDCRNLYENEEISGTLQCKASGGYSLNYQNPVRVGYAVRRLTPLECERLQGFPDGWTDIPGASDTARYKAIGNSIAVPCLDYIFQSMSEVLREGRA